MEILYLVLYLLAAGFAICAIFLGIRKRENKLHIGICSILVILLGGGPNLIDRYFIEHPFTDIILNYDKTNHNILSAKYPFGYALFYVDLDSRIVFSPSQARHLTEYDIDFDSVKFGLSTKNDEDYVIFTIPKIEYLPSHVTIYNLNLGIPKKEGIAYAPLSIPYSESVWWLEILIDRPGYLVCLIGFGPN